MKTELIKQLNQVRANQLRWKDFEFKKFETKEDYKDLNSENREKILVALQFDLKKEDEEFLRFLFEEEIKDRNNDPFQGVTEAIKRCGFLLSKYKNANNVWLFIQAKTANFDCHCGFDWEYILSAGISTTFDFIESNEDESKELFFEYFPSREECELDESDILEWRKNKELEFPNEKEENDLEFWIDIALTVNDKKTAKELLGKFEKQSSDSFEENQTLKYYMNRLGDIQRQIELAEKLLLYPPEQRPFYNLNTHARFIDYNELAKLYLLNNQKSKSWDKIQKAIVECGNENQYGLGLLSEAAINIVIGAEKIESFIHSAYEFATNNLGSFVSLDLSKKYLKAAEIMNNKNDEIRFQELVKERQKEMDDLMSNDNDN